MKNLQRQKGSTVSKILVMGESSLSATAELLTVTIEFRREGAERASCISAVTALNNMGLALAQDRVEEKAVVSYESSGLRVGSFDKWLPGVTEGVLTQYASSTLVMVYQKVARLSEDVSALLSNPDTNLHSAVWSLTDETKHALEKGLRRSAVQDAEVRAEDYASAAGLQLTGCVEIREPGVSSHERASVPHSARAAMSDSSFDAHSGEGEQLVDYVPVEIFINSRVFVEFSAAVIDG